MMRSYKSFQWIKGVAVLLLLPVLSGVALADSTGEVLDLADKPIFMSKKIDAKASIVVSISNEFPVTGAAYTKSIPYTPGTQYIGFFNSNRCYLYDADKDYFYPTYKNTDADYNCVDGAGNGNAFSGNFMNWATMTALDILRYSFTGGERYIDTEDLTVMARSQMANGVAGSQFPWKSVPNDIAKKVVPVGLFYKLDGVEYKGALRVNNCTYGTWFSTGTGCGGDLGRNTNTALTPAGGFTKTDNGVFYPRVVVCDSGSALLDSRKVLGQDRLYCLKYPNGSYKPTGYAQQRYDKARFSLFMYPFSFSGGNYARGAVMRSPLKYVGPTTYNHKYEELPGLNPEREWDPDTGIFIRNPEGRTDINQSGFTSALNNYFPLKWTYPLGDPSAEKYYMVLRYLQGMQPTYVSLGGTGARTNALKEDGTYYYDSRLADGSGGVDGGLPFYTKWEDPHPAIEGLNDYSCIKNAIVTFGDTRTTDDTHIPGYNNANGAPNDAQNIPDFRHWTEVVGGFEIGQPIDYYDNEGNLKTTRGNPTPFTIAASPAAFANLCSGVAGNCWGRPYHSGMAYWANTHDIRGKNWTDYSLAVDPSSDPRRPGMRVRSYFMDANELGEFYSDARARNVNQYYYGAKYGAFDPSLTLDGSNPFLSVAGESTNSIWAQDKVVSGKLLPRGFELSDNGANILNSIDQVFKDMTEASETISGFANNGQYETSLKVGDIVYRGKFNSEKWSGDVVASRVEMNPETGEIVYVDLGWSAADSLKTNTWSYRRVFIGDSNGNFNTFSSKYAPGMDTNLPEGVTVQDRVDYIKGNADKEGSVFRVRNGKLGDIINSSPVFKKRPVQINFDSDYADFYTSHKFRTPMVYVGANDGMLHAFDVPDGTKSSGYGNERFAYIPSFVAKNLYKLTEKDYDHQAFVDATPVVSEAKIVNSGGYPQWITALVGGAGAGGQGVFALNVTSPTSFDSQDVMWEFTDADDPDMGNVMGTPVIVRLATSDPEQPTRWFALVPGGVNSKADDGNKSTAAGPAIFILDLSKPKGTPWVLDSNYYKVILPALVGRSEGIINLRTVVSDKMDLQTIYAGDLSGQLWKIKLTHVPTSSSDIVATRLFETPTSTQSITMPVLVSNGGSGLTLVSFGTGKYLELADNNPNNYTKQTMYTIVDSDEMVKPTQLTKVIQSTTHNNEFNAEDFMWGTASEAVDGSAEPGTTPVRAGWYYDLPVSNNTGERFIYRMALRNGVLVASSLVPSLGECSTGNSSVYMFSLFSGSGHSKTYEDVIYGPIYLVDGGNQLVSDPNTGNVTIGGGGQVSAPGTSGPLTDKENAISSSQLKQLMNWREIYNYNQLRDQSFEKN